MMVRSLFQFYILSLLLLVTSTAQAQLFNNRLSVQGFIKTGTTPVNDVAGIPMRFLIKRNSTVVWCQNSTANVPVISGVFASVLSGASDCMSLSNTLSPAIFVHASNSDTFVVDVVVDTLKNGFGGADDATFAGIDLVPSPLAMSANVAEVANSLSITLPITAGGTGATTAVAARTNLGLGTVSAINTSGVATDVLLGNGIFGPTPVPANFSGNLVGDVTGTQTTTVVGRLQGRIISPTAPTDTQVLAWNNVANQWEPTTPIAAPVTSVAGKTGVVTLVSADVSDAVSTNTPSRLVLRDASGNFAANLITASTFSSVAAGSTNLGDNTSTSTTNVRSGTGGINVAVTGTTGNLSLSPGTTSGTVTVGNASTGLTNIGNTGAAATTTIRSPVINVGLTGTATTTTVGTVAGASTTVIQAGSGRVRVGAAGTAFTSMGACTIAAVTITSTAANQTCTGIPASTAVAVHCTAAAALTNPNTNNLYCRATGTANQLACNTTVANTVSTTYNCMWMQP